MIKIKDRVELSDFGDYEELTLEDVQREGISTDNIDICRKLRRLANSKNIKLDETMHLSGLNKHLFEYFDYCGIDVLQFIKDYLSNLQPYMIKKLESQEFTKSIICVLDVYYRTSMYIKVDMTQHNEMIISFHESYDPRTGIALTNSNKKYTNDMKILVFADQIATYSEITNKFGIYVKIQRGLNIQDVDVMGQVYKDMFVVKLNEIERQLVEYCNDRIKVIRDNIPKLNYNKLDVFTHTQQLSFTSYGKDEFSTISLLIDNFCIQSNELGRKQADSLLTTYTSTIDIENVNVNMLMFMLKQKFTVSSIKKIDILLKHIELTLGLPIKEKSLTTDLFSSI